MVLFILYAIWVLLLFCAWFVLSYLNQPEMGFDDRGTYITETTMSSGRRSHGLGALATAGAGGAGLAALRKRSRSRSRRRPSGGRSEVLSSHPGSHVPQSYADEKYTEVGRNGNTWRDRLLGAGATAGGFFAFKSLFGRKKREPADTVSDVSYGRPLGPSEVTQTDLSRVEEGRAPASPARDHWRRVEEREAAQAAAMGASPLRQGHRPTRSATSIDSFDSRTSFNDEHERTKDSHGLRDGIAALGFAGFVKHQWNKRRNKKEDEHVATMRQQDMEEERIARANSQRRRYPDDTLPPRRNRPPSTILSESDISGATPAVSRPDMYPPRSATNLTQTEAAGPSVISAPPPVEHHGVLSDSGSEAYISAGGGTHRRHHNRGTGASDLVSRRDPSQRRGSHDDSVASPPVSVKVKMHNDGRHVTLRRLNEEEAAAEREARKKDRNRRNRDGSMSSLSNLDNERWRRTAAMEAAQANEMAQPPAPIPMPEPVIPPPAGPSVGAHDTLPPPPPIPGAGGSVLSSPPGTHTYGTETDLSNYDSNRRRRRAERAQAKQARMGGSRVEFS